MRSFLTVITLSIATTLPLATLSAQSPDEARRISDSILVLEEMMAAGDKAVPASILEKAVGVAVFPSLLKGGFFVGGQRGHGILSVRDKKTRLWSAPAFLTITGGSIGAQIGGQAIDLILVVNDERGLEQLVKNQFKVERMPAWPPARWAAKPRPPPTSRCARRFSATRALADCLPA